MHYRGVVSPGKVVEHSLPAQTGHGIFTSGAWLYVFIGPAGTKGHKGINVAAGIGHNSGVHILPGHLSGHHGIHSPGHMLIAHCAKFVTHHVDHILHIRKLGHLSRIQKVSGDGFDSVCFKLLTQGAGGKTGNPDHFLIQAALVNGPFGQTGQAGADFSADA